MGLKEKAHTLRRGISEHPLIWGAAAAGCGLGAILRLPLLPPLQESAANVIGAAVGAVLAVAGAAYVSNKQATKNRDTARTILLATLHELDRAISRVLEAAKATDGVANEELEPGDYDGHRKRVLVALAAVFTAVRELDNTARRVESRVAVFTMNLGHVDPTIAITAVDAQACIRQYDPDIRELVEEAPVVPQAIWLQSRLGTGECHMAYGGKLYPFRDDLQVLLHYFE